MKSDIWILKYGLQSMSSKRWALRYGFQNMDSKMLLVKQWNPNYWFEHKDSKQTFITGADYTFGEEKLGTVDYEMEDTVQIFWQWLKL